MSEEEKNKIYEPIKLISLVPYIGPIIIFFGVIRLIIFYADFGISIVNYLEFSEIITSFFDLVIVFVLFIIQLLLQQLLLSDKKDFDAAKKLRQKLITEINSKIIPKLYFQYLKKLFIISTVLIIILLGCGLLIKSFPLIPILFLIGFIVLLIILSITSIEIDRIHYQFQSPVFKKQRAYILLYIFFLAFLVAGFAKYQACSIKKMNSNYGITICLDNDSILSSDNSNYFIGKTQKFIFFHNENLKSNFVIPIDRVKQITFPSK